MWDESEMSIIQKATVYDLQRILREKGDKTYTVKEIEDLMDTYIKAMYNKQPERVTTQS